MPVNQALPQCGHGCWPPARTNGFGGRWVAISSDICQSIPTKIQNTHVRVKMGFYISQYPIFRIAQSYSSEHHLDFSGKHSAILHEDYSYTNIHHCLWPGIINTAE